MSKRREFGPKPRSGALNIIGALPRLALSRLLGGVADLPVEKSLRRPVYSAFASMVGANLDEMRDEPESFENFNAFFTRELQEGARPDSVPQGCWASPADGRIDQLGRIEAGRLVQAKGISYRASDLLHDMDADRVFDEGHFATVYLSPADYHRVHAPTDMRIHDILHVGGDLWPVNGLSVPAMRDLFVVNERVIARFRDAQNREGALVMVGATIVGRISLERDLPLRDDHRVVERRIALDPPWELDALDRFGAFELGSTVVLLVEKSEDSPLVVCEERRGRRVQLGDVIFHPRGVERDS